MSKAFIRGLWGIYEHEGRRFFKRRTKLDNDFKLIRLNKNAPKHITYVFGKDNYKYLIDQGFEARLVDKRPIVWDMNKEQFRHKLEVLHQGMQEFDEIVFLDWDCTACRPLPRTFWKQLRKKASIQAVLRRYHKIKAPWRKTDRRKFPEASFVYVNDPQVTIDLNNLWEKMGRPWSEEKVMAKYIDGLMENPSEEWLNKYWNAFEPHFATWGNAKVPSPQALDTGYYFVHINYKVVARLLNRAAGNSDQLTKLIAGLPAVRSAKIQKKKGKKSV